MEHWNIGDKVCLPGCQREAPETVIARDRFGRVEIEWADGSGSYHLDQELVEPELNGEMPRQLT
jgi:hypothetical protein